MNALWGYIHAPTVHVYILCIIIDLDECATELHSCANGATCVNTQGSYTCDCTGTGYGGSDCSIGNTIMKTPHAIYIDFFQL